MAAGQPVSRSVIDVAPRSWDPIGLGAAPRSGAAQQESGETKSVESFIEEWKRLRTETMGVIVLGDLNLLGYKHIVFGYDQEPSSIELKKCSNSCGQVK